MGDEEDRRIRFYGLGDYGTYFQISRVGSFIERFNEFTPLESMSDVIELHQVECFISNGLIDESLSSGVTHINQLGKKMKAIIAKRLNSLTDEDLVDSVDETLDWQYHADLLRLFGEYKVYERCSPAALLMALDAARFSLSEMLAEKRLVKTIGTQLRDRMLGDPKHAALVVRKHLEKQDREVLYFPADFTTEDGRSSLQLYLEAVNPNPNIVKLIATAKASVTGIVTPKLKLQAQRLHDRLMEDFFKENSGMRMGVEVSLIDDQREAVTMNMDGGVAKFRYSRHWFEATLDNLAILGNLVHVFEWVDQRNVSTMPSFKSERSALESLFRTEGQHDYPTGAGFSVKEMSSTLQVHFYQSFLESKQQSLEGVVEWFFSTHLPSQYSAEHLRFMPSSRTATYLERCRHLFVEMESVAKQYSLFVENGHLDTGLMSMASDQVRYKEIPSLIHEKYVYAAGDVDIQCIMTFLFSDQAHLGYINGDLRAKNLADLLLQYRVPYSAFHDYQNEQIDFLIERGVLRNEGERIWFADGDQFVVLRDIYDSEVANYFQYAPNARVAIDEMVNRGWLQRRTSLLAEPEGSYFNYLLNQREFSNGPDLRNRYMHGSHADPSNENEHFQSYLIALKLILVLVIKINDDLWISSQLRGTSV